MECESCGARLGLDDLHCPYCGTPTALGKQRQYLDAQYAAGQRWVEQERTAAQRQADRLSAQRTLQKTSNLSLVFGLVGAVLCCSFVPSVLALVFGLRARRLARERELTAPLGALVGISLGAIGLVSGVVLIAIGVWQEHEKTARIKAIDEKLKPLIQASSLSHEAACLLTERRLLEVGHNGQKGADGIECLGPLDSDGTLATLKAVRFRQSSDERTVCVRFGRGTTWYVESIGVPPGCGRPEEKAPPIAPSGSTTAPPTDW